MACSALVKTRSSAVLGRPSFYGYDGFGSVRRLTTTGGVVTDTYGSGACTLGLIVPGHILTLISLIHPK